MDLLTLVTWRKYTSAEWNLVVAVAKEKDNKELLICQILNLPFAWILFLLTGLDFWLAVTAVIVPNRKAGVLAPHHHNIKNINSGLVTVQFPGVLLTMRKKKKIYVKHAHLMSPMTWSGKDSSGCWKKPDLGHYRDICSWRVEFPTISHLVRCPHINAKSYLTSENRSFLWYSGISHTSDILN